MKQVLIITYDMIPYTSSWGACQRMYFFSEYLKEKGYSVDVFSCKKQIEDDYGKVIHFTNHPIEIKNGFYRHFINSRARGTKIAKENRSVKTLEMLAKARRFVKDNPFLLKLFVNIDRFLFNEPTTLGGAISNKWIRENIKDILFYIGDNKIDTVIISAPAFGMFSAARYIKHLYKNRVNLIFDYRDPWNLWRKESIYSFKKEKYYLQFADEIVCTTDYLCDDMSEEFKIDRNRFHTIANGYSEKNWEDIVVDDRGRNDCFVISYIGQIELIYQGIRNIEKVIEAFRRLDKKNIMFRIVGVNDITLDNVKNLKREFRNKIEIFPPVKAEQSLEYMLDSDVLLLLHTTDDSSGRYIVSGKFYDYARAGKCILSVDNGKGNHKKLIDKYGLGISVRNDTDEILSAIKRLYKEWEDGTIEKYSHCDISFSREYQYKEYETILDRMKKS